MGELRGDAADSPSEGGRSYKRVLSVGHSSHTPEAFLDLLKGQQVQVLVDVRSHPYSKFVPHFNAPEMKKAVVEAGIKYLFLGKELGGRPSGDEYYDRDGHVLYARVAVSPLFLEGIRRLERGAAEYRVALVCSEENPSNCHRRLLVGRVLAQRCIIVEHLRGDGRIQSEVELEAEAEGSASSGQASLITVAQEYAWRSTRSVLRRGRPASSSKR